MSDELRTQQEIAPCGFSTAEPVPAEQQPDGFSTPSEPPTPAAATPVAARPQTDEAPPAAPTAPVSPPAGRRFFSLAGTVRLTYAAVFVALGVVLKLIRIPMGPIQLSFVYIPVFLSAAFFGPAIGFCVGCLCDLLGCVIAPSGPPVVLITIGNGLMGALMGLAFLLPVRNKALKIVIGAAATLFFVTLGLNSFALARVYGVGFFAYLVMPVGGIIPRIAFQPLMLAANTILTIALYYPLEKLLSRMRRRPAAKPDPRAKT